MGEAEGGRMKKHRLASLLLTGLLIVACGFPLVNPTTVAPTETASPTAAEATAVTTDTATVVPTATSVPTPSVPMASPSGQAVNCRSGPSLGWEVVTLLQYGQSAEIVGKTIDGSWLEVKPPSSGDNPCWVSAGVVTATGDLSRVQAIAPPPVPTSLPTVVVMTLTDVSVSVSPSKINVPGCTGPIQPSTAIARITVNGPVKLHWHFETDQNGKLPTHALIFSKAGTKEVSESFTPVLSDGKYSVELHIDGFNLDGMNAVATYRINC
jgi:uncharacterized protein YraI